MAIVPPESTDPFPGVYVHLRPYPDPAPEGSSDETGPDRLPGSAAGETTTTFFGALHSIVDSAVVATAGLVAPLAPAYGEHPRQPGIWERLGWAAEIARRATPPMQEAIGRALAQLRRSRGMSQDDLARAVQVPRSTYQWWESGGGGINVTRIPALARALQLTPADLMQQLQPGEVDTGRD